MQESGTPAEERNVSYFVRPLRKHTWLIGLFVLLALVGSFAYWLATGPRSPYEAQAIVILKLNNGGQVDLGQNAQFRDTSVDVTRLQRNAVLLGSSLNIASNVVQNASSNSDPQIKALATGGPLLLREDVNVKSTGDYITVKADAPTAAAATWLANEWARQTVRKVNSTYAAPSPNADQALQGVKTQLDQDQKALQDFLSSNPISAISQELSQTVEFIQKAGDSQTVNRLTLYDAEQRGLRDQVASNYAAIGVLDERISALKALRSRISEGPDDPSSLLSNQVALLLMVNSVMSVTPRVLSVSPDTSAPADNQGAGSGSQVQLQISLADLGKTPLSRGSQLRDIDSTIAAVQGLQADIRTRTGQLEDKLNRPGPTPEPGSVGSPPAEVQRYVNRQNELESALETKNFELDRLRKARDLDQTTYDLLSSRVAEQQVNQAISAVVDIGVEASVEQAVKTGATLRALIIYAVGGMLIALAVGVGLGYLLYLVRPDLDTNRRLRSLVGRERHSRDSEVERPAQVGSGG